MNLDALKQHVRAVTEEAWCGQKIWLRKIGATDGLALFSTIRKLNAENRTEDDDRAETLNFNAGVISKSLANEAGELEADSPEGIETLKTVNFMELAELAAMVLKHSGYTDAKKNLPQGDSPPTGSALNSDGGHTPTTS